jgi:hypothetical protein
MATSEERARRRGVYACVGAVLLGGASAMIATSACSSVPDDTTLLTINGPSLADFSGAGGVSAVFERNCGSLDCHGSDSRPLRIYGQYGLRKPVGLVTVVEDAGEGGTTDDTTDDTDAGPPVPGGVETTAEETLANYQAVISLEPRVMQAVVKGADPYQLLILKKPLEIEKHKGGPALHKSGDAENCIVSWLKNKTDKAACTAGSKLP